ncbi:MAG: hemerythrin domain-containing protein [Spirochaetia bacterium]
MKPRGPLMIEHRLIEKMLHIISDEIALIEKGKPIDPLFIDAAVDFIRIYADKTHHGKEEDILFKQLAERKLAAEDAAQMRRLVEEHGEARQKVRELVEAKERLVAGDKGASSVILASMRWLVDFYPVHIAREDKEFFPRTEKYFSENELARMLDEFGELDRRMIHEKYENLVKSLQRK